MVRYYILILIGLVSCNSLRYGNSERNSGTIEQITEKTNLPINSKPEQTKYISLLEFKNDTLNYIKNSILSRKEHYTGKELNVLLSDLEIPVKGYLISTSHLKGVSLGISLQFYPKNVVELKKQKQTDPIIMTIRWAIPLPMDSTDALLVKNKGIWTQDERLYFGKQKVQDIGLVRYNFN